MKKRPSLVRQIQTEFQSMLAIGESKHDNKHNGNISCKIFSWATYSRYVEQSCTFGKWAQKKHGCRYIHELVEYVPEYLEYRIDKGLSPYTIRFDAAAISKLLRRKSTEWGVIYPVRARDGITRSRVERPHDKHFSETKNKKVVDFLNGTGLRRHELIALRPDEVNDDGTIVIVWRGKGGKYRRVPVLPQYVEHVKAMKQNALLEKKDRVFNKSEIKYRMDIHSYRRKYAQNLYDHYLKTGQFVSGGLYRCRRDMRGVVFDRGAMRAVSKALGHNRLDVVAISYLSPSQQDALHGEQHQDISLDNIAKPVAMPTPKPDPTRKSKSSVILANDKNTKNNNVQANCHIDPRPMQE